ncbi:hypothetical protein AB3X96_11235 [Paraburkholderia sp. BR13439]|uniref:hypothetical protein n=1 Tax=Paraburkholderia TaxID=1822464 RepID=UPI0015954310|nr:hypothetical protein [Paraburkholderia youngii]
MTITIFMQGACAHPSLQHGAFQPQLRFSSRKIHWNQEMFVAGRAGDCARQTPFATP